MPRAKKGQQKVPTLMKATGLCPTRCYYSTGTGQLSTADTTTVCKLDIRKRSPYSGRNWAATSGTPSADRVLGNMISRTYAHTILILIKYH